MYSVIPKPVSKHVVLYTVVRAIVTDIEGTTTSLAFVKEVLFPYSTRHLPGFVRAQGHRPEVRQLLDEAGFPLNGKFRFALTHGLERISSGQGNI